MLIYFYWLIPESVSQWHADPRLISLQKLLNRVFSVGDELPHHQRTLAFPPLSSFYPKNSTWSCQIQPGQNSAIFLSKFTTFINVLLSVGLCFGFALKTVLKMWRYFHYCWAAQMIFLLLPLPHQRVGWGHTRNWERTQQGLLTPTKPEDMPYHMMLSI